MGPLDENTQDIGSAAHKRGNVLNMRHGGLPTAHELLVRKRRHRQAVVQAEAMLARARQVQFGLIHGPQTGRAVFGLFNQADLSSVTQQLGSAVDNAKSKLDSLTEMGELESLRLHMAMDRMTKIMATLSNILKRIGDTSQGISQNLK